MMEQRPWKLPAHTKALTNPFPQFALSPQHSFLLLSFVFHDYNHLSQDLCLV